MVLTSACLVLAWGNIAHVLTLGVEKHWHGTIRGLCLNVEEEVRGESFHPLYEIRRSTLGSVLLRKWFYTDKEIRSSSFLSSGSLTIT